MKKILTILLFTLPVFISQASELKLEVEIPVMDVAEYHAPYVAIWIQSKDKKHLVNLALWYDIKMKNGKGEEWLKDIRQWWRHSGRDLDFPVDGFSGATRKPGNYQFNVEPQLNLDRLPAGDYKLLVEAVREVGGREIIKIPLSLPVKKQQTIQKNGKKELGKIAVTLIP